jgi:hypothetical protein
MEGCSMKRKTMKTKISFLIICIILILGCGTTKIYNSEHESIYINEPEARYYLLKHFTKVENLCVTYLEPIATYDISPIIRRALGENNGDDVIHVTWKRKESLQDAGLAFFSFGQVRCMDIVVEGDVIKWNRDYILQTSKPKEY